MQPRRTTDRTVTSNVRVPFYLGRSIGVRSQPSQYVGAQLGQSGDDHTNTVPASNRDANACAGSGNDSNCDGNVLANSNHGNASGNTADANASCGSQSGNGDANAVPAAITSVDTSASGGGTASSGSDAGPTHGRNREHTRPAIAQDMNAPNDGDSTTHGGALRDATTNANTSDNSRQPNEALARTQRVCGNRLPNEPWRLRCNVVCDLCKNKHWNTCDGCRANPPPIHSLPSGIREHCPAEISWATYNILNQAAPAYQHVRNTNIRLRQQLVRARYAVEHTRRRGEENARAWHRRYCFAIHQLSTYIRQHQTMDAYRARLYRRCREELLLARGQGRQAAAGPQVARGPVQTLITNL